MNTSTTHYPLDELNLERSLGQRSSEREVEGSAIPLIDLSNFDERREEITEQLWHAATEVGFFQLSNHGLSVDEINHAFGNADKFFGLETDSKAQYPLKEGTNAGWEYKAQVRPSTGTADQKESYQITRPNMTDLWPNRELPAFKGEMLEFERRCWELGMKVLSCFADRLGFERDFFAKAHDQDSEQYQSTLRLLHYLAIKDPKQLEGEPWRAGAHTDFDCLTMVFQKTGQGGLQASAGKDASDTLTWHSVPAVDGIITCNIGDMLMRWSDDQLKSTLHRVRMPRAGEYMGHRYSMAFFCQANRDVVIEGPNKRYPAMTAAEYLNMRMNANYTEKSST